MFSSSSSCAKIHDEAKQSRKRKSPMEDLKSECNKAQLALAHAQLRIGELESAQAELESSKEAIEILREDKRKLVDRNILLEQNDALLKRQVHMLASEFNRVQEENNFLKIQMPQIMFQSMYRAFMATTSAVQSTYYARFYQPSESKAHIEVIDTKDEAKPSDPVTPSP